MLAFGHGWYGRPYLATTALLVANVTGVILPIDDVELLYGSMR